MIVEFRQQNKQETREVSTSASLVQPEELCGPQERSVLQSPLELEPQRIENPHGNCGKEARSKASLPDPSPILQSSPWLPRVPTHALALENCGSRLLRAGRSSAGAPDQGPSKLLLVEDALITYSKGLLIPKKFIS